MTCSRATALGALLLLIASGTVLGGFRDASALGLKLESSEGTTVVIEDSGPGDADPTLGVISFIGSIDGLTLVVATGVSKPVVGNPGLAQLGFSVVSNTSNTGGTLTISLTDTGFLASSSGDTSLTAQVGGVTDGLTTLQSYLDTADAAFGISGPTVCTSGPQGPFGLGAFDNTATGPCSLNGASSITVVAQVTLGANAIQSFGANTQVAAPTAPLACRFTGGGVDTSGNWNHQLETGEMVRNGAGNLPPGIDRYQFGGQVGARTALQPQPSGEWQHHQQTGPSGRFSFHGGTASAAPGTRIVDVRCSDPGFCSPARPAPVKQLDFDGIGTFSNVGKGSKAPTFQIPNPNVIPEPASPKGVFTFHWFEVNIDDLGEPGGLNSGAPNSQACPGRGFGEKSAGPFMPAPGQTVMLPFAEFANCDCPDFYRITIYRGVLSTDVKYLPDGRIDPTSLDRTKVIYEVFGYVDGGNLQIHPPTGFDSK